MEFILLSQIILFVFHFKLTFFLVKGFSWRNEINFSDFDPNGNWNKWYGFSENVDKYFWKVDLVFNFSTFHDWLNVYTVSYIIFDISKYITIGCIFWQFSKVFSQNNDFSGFTTEGVKRLHLIAFLTLLIPFFSYVTKWIFVIYAGTQSTYIGSDLVEKWI